MEDTVDPLASSLAAGVSVSSRPASVSPGFIGLCPPRDGDVGAVQGSTDSRSVMFFMVHAILNVADSGRSVNFDKNTWQ